MPEAFDPRVARSCKRNCTNPISNDDRGATNGIISLDYEIKTDFRGKGLPPFLKRRYDLYQTATVLVGNRGCIFCSAGGSGDFAAAPDLSVHAQILSAKKRIQAKTGCKKFIAYFQAYTNTYAPIEYLRRDLYGSH